MNSPDLNDQAVKIDLSDRPTVSLVMFTYNRIEYTREALHTLMKNTHYPFDLYIIDNYSTDGTREWLETVRLEYPDRIKDVRYNSTNEGLPVPTNDFWSRVDSELIGKVDNDTLVPPGWLERLVEAHQKIPKLAVVGGYHFRPEDFDDNCARSRLFAHNGINILPDVHIGGCCYLMKKSIQKIFGPMKFNPALKIHGWTEYQNNMTGAGYIIGYLYPLIQLEYMDDPRSKKCLINEKYQDYTRKKWRERGINFKSTDQIIEWLHRDAQRIIKRPSSENLSFEGKNQQTNKSYYGYARPEIQALVSPKAKNILDIGCGAGVLGKELKNRQKCCVAGIEYAPEAANKAETALDRVYMGDAAKIMPEIQENSFDTIIMADFIEHIANPEKILSEVKRILIPGGRLVLSIPNVRHWSVIKDLLEGRWEYRDAGILDKTHLRFFTWQSILSLLNSAGYHIDSYSGTYLQGYDVPAEFINLSKQCGIDTSSLASEGRIYQYLISCIPKSGDELPEIVIQKQTVAQNKLTSLIILAYNQLEYTKRCIGSIFTHTKEAFELIVVDNGSTDGTVEYLESETLKRKSEDGGRRSDVRIKIIKNKENLGFAAGNNQGIAAARGDYILLINNDVVVTPGWLSRMVACAEKSSMIGMVGPKSNYVSGPQYVENVSYDINNLNGLERFSSEFAKIHSGKTTLFWRVVGFCMLIKRAVIEKIGGLDARYGLGNFEDDDFSLRAILAGYESRIAEDCFVHHYGNRTFLAAQIDYKKSLHKNWELFKGKWGIPKDVPYGSPFDLSFLVTDGFIHSKHYCSIREMPDLQIGHEDARNNLRELGNLPKTNGLSRSGSTSTHSILLDEVESNNLEPERLVAKKRAATVSIILSLDGILNLVKECIKSVMAHTRAPYEILLVNRGATKGILKWAQQLVKENDHCRMIECARKAGLAEFLNQAVEKASGDMIVLMHNDVVVSENWLKAFNMCINLEPNIGIMGPMSNRTEGNQQVIHSDEFDAVEFESVAKTFYEQNQYRRVTTRKLSDFCLAFPRELPEKIGYFDEQFASEEVAVKDFCKRAASGGYQNLIAADTYFYHYDRHKVKKNTSTKYSASAADQKKYKEKWDGAQNPQAKAYQAVQLLSRADELSQGGQIDAAVQTLLGGIGVRPEDKRFYLALSEILLAAKRFQDAKDALTEMPSADENQEMRKAELLGYAEEGLENFEAAMAHIEQVLVIYPDRAPAFNLKGILAYRNDDRHSAEKYFKRAIDADPGYGEPYTNLGMLQLEADQQEEALRSFEKGFRLTPTDLDIATNYHTFIARIAGYETAENVARDATFLYPNNQKIKYMLIDFLIQQEKYEMAMAEIENAIIKFGTDNGIIGAALKVREKLGPVTIQKSPKKSPVSVCIIIKDEEKYLPRCLASVKPIVDEMIVVDTGSTDRSKDIAIAFGAKVFDFEWRNDFAEARNYSISQASGEWILIIDGDEVISPLDHEDFCKMVKKTPLAPIAYSIITRNYNKLANIMGWMPNDGNYPDEETAIGWLPSEKVRLFYGRDQIWFEGAVHELVDPALKRNGIEIKKCRIPVHHYGRLDKEKLDRKGEIYFDIGRKKLSAMGDDLNALRELAIQATILEKNQEAFELWQRLLALNPNPHIAAIAYVNMATIYNRLGKFEDALDAGKKAVKFDPDLKEARYNHAMAELHCGNAPQTIEVLEDLLKGFPDYPPARFILSAAYCCADQKEKGLEGIKILRDTPMGAHLDIPCLELVQSLISAGKMEYAIWVLGAAIESDIVNPQLLVLFKECLNMKEAVPKGSHIPQSTQVNFPEAILENLSQ